MSQIEDSKLRIFLCHASEDKSKVRHLYDELKNEGFDPWLDEIDILPGQDFGFEISQAVEQAHIVLVCLSKESITKAGYVQKEISYALDQADKQPEGAIFVIPLKLEECNVPQRLSKWHWVNYFEKSGPAQLVKSLKKRCSDLNLKNDGEKILSKSKIYSVLNHLKTAYQENKLLSWNDFEWVSNSRRELSPLLNEEEVAFALKCALQHGKNIPFWCNLNSKNPHSIDTILKPIFENYGRRPLLRAGYAMEKLDSELKKNTYIKIYPYLIKLKEMGNDVPLRIIEAANSGKTIDLWMNELQTEPPYNTVIKQLIQEISEPEL